MKKRRNIMRKKLLKIALMVVFPLITNAQWSITGGLSLNKSNFVFEKWTPEKVGDPIVKRTFSTNIIPDFSIGIKKNMIIGKKIGLSSELRFIKRSLDFPYPPVQNMDFQHISLHNNFCYNLTNKLMFKSGPQVDYLLNRNKYGNRYYVKSTLNKINLSGGLGLEYKLFKKLSIDMSYNRNIISAIRSSENSLHYNTVLINLSYYFQK
ncbi:outer membrane beta-barrel protein [Lacihabitans sp. CS3-21]|uniref:outer membrane beta-barrel protein n=1 Tax=Lacihabitans sp. CS3-21 TaxID=2487332 RepID=UPI0020CF090D|nr:outer membrane beta-barrel protein [Lacihabitans sp. CS3-21]MCP9745206.1 hypothetical protein [Lacihabitans sp. CS3-21]